MFNFNFQKENKQHVSHPSLTDLRKLKIGPPSNKSYFIHAEYLATIFSAPIKQLNKTIRTFQMVQLTLTSISNFNKQTLRCEQNKYFQKEFLINEKKAIIRQE